MYLSTLYPSLVYRTYPQTHRLEIVSLNFQRFLIKYELVEFLQHMLKEKLPFILINSTLLLHILLLALTDRQNDILSDRH